MKQRLLLLFLMCSFCLVISAQTKFAGVPLNSTYQTFCEEMSKKFEPVFYPNGTIKYYSFTFLGINNCKLFVSGIDYEIYLQIQDPYDDAIGGYDHTEEAIQIFNAYTKKYGTHKYYSNSYYSELGWTIYRFYWELKDCEIELTKTILRDGDVTWEVFYHTGEYRPGKETMSIHSDLPKRQVTLDDI